MGFLPQIKQDACQQAFDIGLSIVSSRVVVKC